MIKSRKILGLVLCGVALLQIFAPTSFAREIRTKGMQALTAQELQNVLKNLDLDRMWRENRRRTDPAWEGVTPWPVRLGVHRVVIQRGVQALAEGFCRGLRCDGFPCVLAQIPRFTMRDGAVIFAENTQCTHWWNPQLSPVRRIPQPGPPSVSVPEVEAVLKSVDQSNRLVQLLPEDRCSKPSGGVLSSQSSVGDSLPPQLDTCQIPSELKSAEGSSFVERVAKQAWATTCFFGLTAVNMGIDWALDPPTQRIKIEGSEKKEGGAGGGGSLWWDLAISGCRRFVKSSGLGEMAKKSIADRLHDTRIRTVPRMIVPDKDGVELDNRERLEILKREYKRLLDAGAILPENTQSIGKLMELAEETLNRDAAKRLYKTKPGLPKNLDNTKIIDHLEKILNLPSTSSPVDQSRMKETFDAAFANYSPEIQDFGKKLRDKLIRDSMAPVTDKVPRKTVVFLGGEPGTGKTQLVQSIAKAMGKPYFEFLATGMSAKELIAKIDDCMIHSEDLMPVIFIDEASDVLNAPEVVGGKNGPVKGARTDAAAVLLPVTEKKQVTMRSPFLSEGIDGLKNDIFHNMRRPVIFFAGNGEITEAALRNRLWRNVWFPGFSLESRRKIAHQKFQEKLPAFDINPKALTQADREMLETIVQLDHQYSPGARTLDDSVDDFVRYLSDRFHPLEGGEPLGPFDPRARYAGMQKRDLSVSRAPSFQGAGDDGGLEPEAGNAAAQPGKEEKKGKEKDETGP